ncbi:hypothetical protein AB1Y20_009927 [Prymnesium parvum]|uniref:Uncharacterized protein n=1 Tax=Prymnesium parvum TaxID=97485 RepID=A0AB34K6T0_PRYPA
MRFGKAFSGKSNKSVVPSNEAATVDPPDMGIREPQAASGAVAAGGAGTHAIPASQAAACAGTDAAAATQAAASQAAAIEPDPTPSPLPSPPQSTYTSRNAGDAPSSARSLAFTKAEPVERGAEVSEENPALDSPAMHFVGSRH